MRASSIRATARALTATLVAVLLVLVGSFGTPAAAAPILVDCGSGGDLAAALAAAPPGATIVVQGTCVGNFTLAKDVTLRGQSGATLDGNGSGTTLAVDSTVVAVIYRLTVT